MRVEIGLTTTGKYENLAVVLWSLVRQSMKSWDLTIVDDSKDNRDLRTIPAISDILKLISAEKHRWRVLFGQRKGWHYAQQLILERAENPLIWILDEDHALELNTMIELFLPFSFEKVGATGGVYYLPGDQFRAILPPDWETRESWNGLIYANNRGVGYGSQLQVSIHPTLDPKNVDHLTGSMMYRTEVGRKWGFNLDLSYIAKTSDDWFSYNFYLAGYKLLVIPSAIIWHFPTTFYGTMNKTSEEYTKMAIEDRIKFEAFVRSHYGKNS
jgi:GT2 family glycosyltransferase